MTLRRHARRLLGAVAIGAAVLACDGLATRPGIAEALVEATGCALARPAFAEAVLRKYTKVSDPASLRRGQEELRAAVPADLTPLPEAIRNIAREAVALNPGLNAEEAAKFFAPEVLSQLRANGFMQQAALCKTGP